MSAICRTDFLIRPEIWTDQEIRPTKHVSCFGTRRSRSALVLALLRNASAQPHPPRGDFHRHAARKDSPRWRGRRPRPVRQARPILPAHRLLRPVLTPPYGHQHLADKMRRLHESVPPAQRRPCSVLRSSRSLSNQPSTRPSIKRLGLAGQHAQPQQGLDDRRVERRPQPRQQPCRMRLRVKRAVGVARVLAIGLAEGVEVARNRRGGRPARADQRGMPQRPRPGHARQPPDAGAANDPV